MINEETLLFFDEIQYCPEAIMSLRYFKEKMPNIPIIGAGSLLEFALMNEKFKMPAGRVDFMYLEPLSFDEYLEVTGNGLLKDYLKTVTLNAPPDNIVHEKLTTLLKEYFVIGGMPAVVDSYLKNKNMSTCQRLQSGLMQSFRSDFGKYAKTSQHKHLQQTFNTIPGLVGKQIK